MRRIHSFVNFINEQEKDKKEGGLLDAGSIAQAMLDRALKDLTDNNYTEIADTEETKGGLPVKSCGSTPYQFKPVEYTNQKVMNLFKEPDGKFSKDIRYSEISKIVTNNDNKIFLVGVREDLDIKKKEGDRFTDKMMIVDPTKPNEKVVSYQITTSPSVAYYGDPKRALNKSGVAIMQPGVTQYKVGVHRKGSPTEHEALIQAGPMKINRFELNKTEIDTYKPGKEDTGDEYGINIHRSSKDLGICVGPYSAGCQVFANGNDFADFMNRIKAASQNNGVFLYVLIENDDLSPDSTPEEDKTNDVEKKEQEKEQEGKVAKEKNQEEETILRNTARDIYKELDKTNSDEDALIKMYNRAVTDKESANKIREIYKDMYDADIIDAMDGALVGSELEQLQYK